MDTYRTARTNKDRGYDGRFFFGVKTTGIFCRPSCPAPIAKEENVVYFENAYQAMEAGFTPCYRCRPDLHLEYPLPNPDGSLKVRTALEKIRAGYLNNHSVGDLARALNLSERQLRQLFVASIGVAPKRVANHCRVLFARKLLLTTAASITQVAFASGYSSVRQFNGAFRGAFACSPRDIRRAGYSANAPLEISIPCAHDVDFAAMLSFMRPRAVPRIESITAESYTRSFRTETARGSFSVAKPASSMALVVNVEADKPECLMEIHQRVRHMFDLDTDLVPIKACFQNDPFLAHCASRIPRLPKSFCAFEFIVRAVLGQQIPVRAATTLAGRIAALTQERPTGHSQCSCLFPTPRELLDLDLGLIGVTRRREDALRAVARAVLDGQLDLSRAQPFESFYAQFAAMKGIGDWTAQYVGMRALGYADCFPVSDLGIVKALAYPDGTRRSRKEMLSIAEAWRPYRSYAALCLWQNPTP